MDMNIKKEEIQSKSIKITVHKAGKEAGRVFLQFVVNDLHENPYGVMEDLFVHEEFRRQGFSKVLIEKVIESAKEHGCHKLIINSRLGRDKLHAYYKRFGFQEHGKEFRIDF